jgi:hypothetical protein
MDSGTPYGKKLTGTAGNSHVKPANVEGEFYG